MVTVYSKPQCSRCVATKSFLEMNNIPFQEIDVTKDAAAMEKAFGFGIKEMPIVEYNGDVWGGFKPEKLALVLKQAA